MSNESNTPQPQTTPPESNLNGKSYDSLSNMITSDINRHEMLKTLEPNSTDLSLSLQATPLERFVSILILSSIAVMLFALVLDNIWMALISGLTSIILALSMLWPTWGKVWTQLVPAPWRTVAISCLGLISGIVGLLMLSGDRDAPGGRHIQVNWDAIGSLAELIGALGQLLIAIIAVYVAWRQYIISKDLTIQQNRITQQQTIDAYFQGVVDLALDDNGFLEDWPQERAFAEGRTAAILGSVDAEGKAKILRFLSQSKLLTPLKRDKHLGRPILDGNGGYAEDRLEGLRVIDIGLMLAGANMAGSDLRWTDLSEANLLRADLRGADLGRANLSRTILYEANLAGSDLRGTIFFYGSVETASPRNRHDQPNYSTGAHTGTVVENVDFSAVKSLSDEARYYCCAWCGSKSRETIPGGCDDIPNKLGR